MMKRTWVLLISLCLSASPGRAGMITSGDVTPADPADWGVATLPVVGTFGVGSVTIDNDSDAISFYGALGHQPGSSGTVTISGEGSRWTNTDGLTVGYYGNGVVNVANGGTLINGIDAHLGNFVGSTGVVTVSGADSTWTDVRDTYVGFAGDGILNVGDGGSVNTGRDCYIGYESGSKAEMNITNSKGEFYITNGGAAGSRSGYIGYKSDSTGSLLVSGAGSTWTNSGQLSVGYEGYGTLKITRGGSVSTRSACIGEMLDSTGSVIVGGEMTAWTNSRDLCIGDGGVGTLEIRDGGFVSNHDGRIGGDSDFGSGTVTVSDFGSTWTNSGYLQIGHHGEGLLDISEGGLVAVSGDTLVGRRGTLNISGGGLVTGGDTRVTAGPGSTGVINFDNGTLTTNGLRVGESGLSGTGTINTTGLVSDLNLVFDATHGLRQTLRLNGPGRDITVNLNVDGFSEMGVGYEGSGAMHISDGLVVESTKGYFGYVSGSTGTVRIDGSGSTWTASRGIEVGGSGTGALDITNGATVTSGRLTYIGNRTGSRGAVRVDGSGSTWTASGGIDVGRYGDGALDITNGATVACGFSTDIGKYADSSGAVRVSGAGSTWTTSGYLRVGYLGVGTLDITNGGKVRNRSTYVGRYSGSSGMITVSGAGSALTNSGSLFVGSESDGAMEIYGGGLVSVAGLLTIDGDGDGDSFVTMASGGMLALRGVASNSLKQFLGLINGTDDIRYWDDSVGGWNNITGATAGEDYTLEYLTEGDLAGYTLLTVNAIPEPATLGVVAIGGLVVLRWRSHR